MNKDYEELEKAYMKIRKRNVEMQGELEFARNETQIVKKQLKEIDQKLESACSRVIFKYFDDEYGTFWHEFNSRINDLRDDFEKHIDYITDWSKK